MGGSENWIIITCRKRNFLSCSSFVRILNENPLPLPGWKRENPLSVRWSFKLVALRRSLHYYFVIHGHSRQLIPFYDVPLKYHRYLSLCLRTIQRENLSLPLQTMLLACLLSLPYKKLHKDKFKRKIFLPKEWKKLSPRRRKEFVFISSKKKGFTWNWVQRTKWNYINSPLLFGSFVENKKINFYYLNAKVKKKIGKEIFHFEQPQTRFSSKKG